MSPLDQLCESIDARIAELKHEMAALQAARAALHGKSASSTRAAVTTDRDPATWRRRAPKRATNGHGPDVRTQAGAEVVDSAATTAGAGPGPSVSTPAKPRKPARAKSAPSAKRVEVLLAGRLEAMLRESGDGLSAITISKRTNAGYNQVLNLLRELEKSGQVRRSGTRRTSLWRLFTDEERIAERAAELERLSATTSGS